MFGSQKVGKEKKLLKNIIFSYLIYHENFEKKIRNLLEI